MNREKILFSRLFIMLAALLVSLPFITTFQELLTRIVMSISAYRFIQDLIVPYELHVITAFLNFLHLDVQSSNSYIQYVVNGKNEVVYLAWNCVGWQSFILFFITIFTGLSGAYTRASKIQAFFIGLLGTYLMNIFRLSIVILIYYFAGKLVGTIFHDYFSNIISITWLFAYWYLIYQYVLEKTTETNVEIKMPENQVKK